MVRHCGRYRGGHNAGHTVFIGEKKFVLKLIGKHGTSLVLALRFSDMASEAPIPVNRGSPHGRAVASQQAAGSQLASSKPRAGALTALNAFSSAIWMGSNHEHLVHTAVIGCEPTFKEFYAYHSC